MLLLTIYYCLPVWLQLYIIFIAVKLEQDKCLPHAVRAQSDVLELEQQSKNNPQKANACQSSESLRNLNVYLL